MDFDLKVYHVVVRSLRCSFYRPEFDAVLERCVELKRAGRPLALSAYKKERKEFVQQSFEVRATSFPVRTTRLLTSSQVWPRRG